MSWFQGLTAQILMGYYCFGLYYYFTYEYFFPFWLHLVCPAKEFILLESLLLHSDILIVWIILSWTINFCMELHRSSGNCNIQEMALRWLRRMVAFTKPITWFCPLALAFSKATYLPSIHLYPYVFSIWLYSPLLYAPLSVAPCNQASYYV